MDKSVFIANFKADSISYLSSHFKQLSVTALVLAAVPLYKFKIRRLRWSLTQMQRLTKPEDLRAFLQRNQEVWLRVKVKGLILTHEDS